MGQDMVVMDCRIYYFQVDYIEPGSDPEAIGLFMTFLLIYLRPESRYNTK
jgi:hypothetical protein